MFFATDSSEIEPIFQAHSLEPDAKHDNQTCFFVSLAYGTFVLSTPGFLKFCHVNFRDLFYFSAPRADFNASEIVLHKRIFNFSLMFQKNVEHSSFGVVGNFEPDDLRWMPCDQ